MKIENYRQKKNRNKTRKPTCNNISRGRRRRLRHTAESFDQIISGFLLGVVEKKTI